jgi:hypothetical protein
MMCKPRDQVLGLGQVRMQARCCNPQQFWLLDWCNIVEVNAMLNASALEERGRLQPNGVCCLTTCRHRSIQLTVLFTRTFHTGREGGKTLVEYAGCSNVAAAASMSSMAGKCFPG